MAGRNKKPIDLHLANGNPSHLTKAEIEERQAQELEVPFTDVEPPSYLDKAQKKKFREIAKMLLALGIMTELDVDCLARYVISHDLYLKYTEKVNALLNTDDIDMRDLNTVQNMQDKAFKQASSSASSLGLTITSRCKIVIPLPPDNEDEDL